MYNISTSVNWEIIEIVITGEVAEDFFEELKNEFNTILKRMNSKKLLIDVRTLKIPRVFSEACSRIIYYPPLSHTRNAIVGLPENADFQSFHETMANSAGIKMKWFCDINAARSWLNSP